MFTNSIRGRFQLWLTFLLVCVLTGFGVAVYQLQRVTQFRQLDEELEHRVAALSSVTTGSLGPFGPGRPPLGFGNERGRGGFRGGPPNRGQLPLNGADFALRDDPRMREIRLPSETAALFDGGSTNGFYFAIWSREADLMKGSSNLPPNVTFPEPLKDTLTHLRLRDAYREAIHFTDIGECIIVGRPVGTDLRALSRFRWILVGVGGIVLAFGLGGGWWLATRAIRPISKISATAERIATGDLTQRIPIGESDNELGRLTLVLNSTFAKLDAAFTRQKQFTADAAHELRTPVSVMLTHAQNGLAADSTGEEQREALEACQRAAQRMRRLIESLLELASLDASQDGAPQSAFDFSQMVRECVELIQPLAADLSINIQCELLPSPCTGQRERLAQVVTNLLTNAIQYNKSDGEVQVSVQSQSRAVMLTVRDTGIGIAAEQLPYVFDRFYRVNAARTSAKGHAGLGLAISKAIIDTHGGTLEVTSQPGTGTTFTMRLPAHSLLRPA